MIKNYFHKKSIKVITVMLFSGLYCAALVNADEENMGITVSRVPAPGWTVDATAPVSKNMLWPVLLTVGGVFVLSGVVILIIKKKKNHPVEAAVATKSEPQLVAVRLPEKKPEPQLASVRLPEKKPEPQLAPACQSEKKPEPPPIVKAVESTVEKMVKTKSSDDDDMLFKHLDLLRSLRDEDKKEGEQHE
jgi:hypothetical protein